MSREFQETKVRIHGRLPTDMLGFYLKNGPNAQFPPKRGQPYHWFDGDGMVHSLRLNGAKNEAIFVNRWVRTERFNRDKDRGDTVFSFGEMQSGNMMAMLDPRGVNEKTQRIIGRMQTNVVYHGGKLLALEETDQPYEMQLPSLSTVGQCTFQGTLNHVMCAHPKLCPQTKEMFLFGHSIDPRIDPKASYSVVSPNTGKVTHTMDVPIRGPRFMHDMAITEQFAVLFDLPATFDFEEWQEGRTPWKHRADIPTRFGIFPRHCEDPDKVRWFDAKSCQIFHTINAFEQDGGRTVVLRACRAESYDMGFDGSDNPKFWLYPYEWVFDLVTGQTLSEGRLSDVRCDFPVISRHVVGLQHRFSYYTTYRARPGDGVPLYDGLAKYDHEQARMVANVRLNEHLSCGECSFVPKKQGKEEDSGYLVVFVSDDRMPNKTELWIFCAETLSDNSTPLARVETPQRVPYGFHGNWIDDMEIQNARSRL